MRVLTGPTQVRDAQVGETSTRPGGGSDNPPPAVPAGTPPRRRGGSGTLLLPPWTRAPLLAFGEPAVIFAVLAATIILACAASSGTLFLSSAASESLHRTLVADCPNAAYPGLQVGPITSFDPNQIEKFEGTLAVEPPPNIADLTALDRKGREALTAEGFTNPYHAAFSDRAMRAGPPPAGADPHSARLFYADGVLSNIKPINRGTGRGVWLPAAFAQKIRARVGQHIPLAFLNVANGPLPETTVAVAGIYQDLWEEPTTPYWCSYSAMIQNPGSADPPPPALLIATDQATFASVQQATGMTALHYWAAPIQTGALTLSGARDVVAKQSDAYRRLGQPAPQDFGSQNSGPGQLPQFALQTSLVRNGLRGPVVPIALGGTILALLLVGAAGSYWADRRSREVRLLSSRGVSPAALAAKAVLELFLPAVIGTLIGWQVARWLVQALGPNPHLDRSAPGQALLTAGLALAAGLALLALVAAQRSRAATERPVGARRTWVALVPWELALLAAALGCYLRLRGGDAVVLDRKVAQINLLVVAFPLLFLVGAAVLAVRVLVLVLMWVTRRAGRRSPAWYLAGRRITAARLASVTLLAAASTPIAMLVYAAGLTQTSEHTLDAKAKLLVGSTVSVRSTDPLTTTPQTARVGTVVTRYLYGTSGGQDVALLAIDPDTFAGTAFWDSRFADVPLGTLLDAIRRPAADGRVAAIVVDPDRSLPAQYDVRLGTSTAHVTTVAAARLFPGRRLPAPMVIVSTARLGPIDPHAGSLYELWSTGSVADVHAALKAQHARAFDVVAQSTVFEAANFLGISWTFGYLSALAALVGLVAVGGLLLYLETRQRSRVAAYALGRRMGLTRGTHLRSLLAELGMLLATAFILGAGLAWAAVLLVYRQLDVDTSRPPAPLLTVPVTALAGGALAVVVVACAASLYAQRAADRGNVSEVLRLGG